MGLATVHAIVRKAGGDISVASKLGEGALFEVLLPATSQTSTASRTEIAEAEIDASSLSVMVVEDNDVVRGVICRMLHSRGFTVLKASNGAEALELYEQSKDQINLVLTDLVMPKMGGVELATELARRPRRPLLLFMSAYGDAELAELDVDVSSIRFIEKPFTVETLLREIALAVGSRRAKET